MFVAGAVNVIYGTASGLDVPDNQQWVQGLGGIGGVAEDFDWFGHSVAVGDFNGDSFDDLAIGVPYEDVGAIADACIAGANADQAAPANKDEYVESDEAPAAE